MLIERGAGVEAQFTDDAYAAAGATLVPASQLWNESDVLLKVRAPSVGSGPGEGEAALLKEGATVVSFMYPAQNKAVVEALAARRATSLAMDMIPRISRAQVFDALRCALCAKPRSTST